MSGKIKKMRWDALSAFARRRVCCAILFAGFLLAMGAWYSPARISFRGLQREPGASRNPTIDTASSKVRTMLLDLPLGFEQALHENEFITRGDDYDLLLQPSRMVLVSGSRSSSRNNRTARLELLHSNQNAKGTASDLLPGKSNYLIGNDPARWRTNVSRFANVRYRDVYPGIDLVYYGKQRELEYDFIVAPGEDAGPIRLAFEPGAKVRISGAGELIAQTAIGEIRQPPPIAYQEKDGKRERVEIRYVLNSQLQVGFETAGYDRTRPLIIDPTLVYSSFLGGSGDDSGSSIALDTHNNIYVTGTTNSPAFPTKNPFAATTSGLGDIFVTKIDAAGGALVYSTYVGGAGQNRADGLAVDYNGNAYVAGRVDSTSINFPTTAGSFAATYRGGDFDAVAFKLNSAGNNFIYSTFLGGEENDSAVGVAVDLSGNAYVTGGTRSAGFPTTATAYQPTRSGDTDGFLVKLNPAGSGLLYSTFLGGGGTDRISGLAIDGNARVFLDGYTGSADFPTQNAFQNSSGGSFDVFVAKFDTNLSGAASLEFCSYLGGAGDDKAYGIAIDGASPANYYLVGQTSSSNFPVLNAAQPASGGNFDAFVAKISGAGSKVFATYLGGSSDDRGTGIALNAAHEVYLTGFTSSTNFPTVDPVQANNGGGVDAFVAKLNAAGSTFIYATYLGGSGAENSMSTVTATNPIALDNSGNAYVTGYTTSANFPTAAPLQAANAGAQDAFIVKISDGAPASLQFSSSSFSGVESDGGVKISVTRTGNTASAVDVDYATSNGSASSRTDYVTSVGTLHFAAGETLKKFIVPVVDDLYVEGNETVNLTIRNPQGSGAFLGTPIVATMTIVDNDTSAATNNPLDGASFFIRQHYYDFLNREPDADGLAYWTNEITKCGNNVACVDDRRISVSASFFASAEFQESGGFVFRLYRGTLGRDPTFSEFSADRSKLIGGPDLQANKVALVSAFISRLEFANKYPDGSDFIAAMAETARTSSGAPLPNLTSDLRQSYDNCVLINLPILCKELTVRQLVDYPEFIQATYNRAFVLMEYFGYLRRDPESGGYAFWLDVLNNQAPNNYRGMVCSFITSAEYQQRFSPVVTRTNAECSGVH
jgi:Calx-beta domain/Beta-propeller repeat/Domain of unknown function (DUF4214)